MSIRIPQMDEQYHSIHGAVQESMHVYINKGLLSCFKNEISVLEYGMGTGLNILLSSNVAQLKKINIKYTSLEKYPLTEHEYIALNYKDDNRILSQIHSNKWGEYNQLTDLFSLRKMNVDFREWQPDEKFDVVYFDAFAPEKQPDLWNNKIFETIYDALNNDAIFVTYCAKGEVRRALQSVGFIVERLEGPPGKREMLRARKILSEN